VLPFPLADVSRVEFFKRDELTTDLICCEVTARDAIHFSHEEAADWRVLLEKLAELPGFRADWFGQVAQPPFAESRFVAFAR
jgi:hypothetical protein